MTEYSYKPLIDKLLKKNILIIDDDGSITKTLCELLKRAGHYADASQNGSDAIDKTEEAVFDLIICDIKMPDMDGVQTVKRMKALSKAKKRSDVPVIFITGYADSPAVSEAKKIGEVIFKPFDTKEFLSKVAKYI